MNNPTNDNKPDSVTKLDVSAQRQKLEKHLKNPESKFNALDLMDAAAQVGYKTAKQEIIDFLVIQHNIAKPDDVLPTRAFLKKLIVALEKSGRG
jgi:hypothetical protein